MSRNHAIINNRTPAKLSSNNVSNITPQKQRGPTPDAPQEQVKRNPILTSLSQRNEALVKEVVKLRTKNERILGIMRAMLRKQFLGKGISVATQTFLEVILHSK